MVPEYGDFPFDLSNCVATTDAMLRALARRGKVEGAQAADFPCKSAVENHRNYRQHHHIVWKRVDVLGQGSFASPDSCLVVAIWRPKGVIIIVAKQLLFLKTLLEAVGRESGFARGQPALGQPQEFRHAAGAP